MENTASLRKKILDEIDTLSPDALPEVLELISHVKLKGTAEVDSDKQKNRMHPFAALRHVGKKHFRSIQEIDEHISEGRKII